MMAREPSLCSLNRSEQKNFATDDWISETKRLFTENIDEMTGDRFCNRVKAEDSMPVVSRFYGISIFIYFNDHHPPHFHVRYNDFKALIDMRNLKIIGGSLPSRVKYLVTEWALLHRVELYENWKLAVTGEPIKKIDPLE